MMYKSARYTCITEVNHAGNPPSANHRKGLEKLAKKTGRTKSYYVREAILQHLDYLEDIYLAEERLARIRSGEERTHALAEAGKDLLV